jgi:hypothetical protein
MGRTSRIDSPLNILALAFSTRAIKAGEILPMGELLGVVAGFMFSLAPRNLGLE